MAIGTDVRRGRELPGSQGAEVIDFPVLAPERPRPRPGRGVRFLGAALVGCGVAMLPWLVVLANALPASARVPHWSAAWVGLDALEAAGLAVTGRLVLRRDPRRCLTATATAVLLVVDAWFDVVTSAPGTQLATAVAMAVGAELPMAALCLVLALRSLPRPDGRGGPVVRPLPPSDDQGEPVVRSLPRPDDQGEPVVRYLPRPDDRGGPVLWSR